MAATLKLLYTTREAAESLGMTETIVRKLCADGELTAIKTPGSRLYRIHHEDLQAYADGLRKRHTHEPGSPA